MGNEMTVNSNLPAVKIEGGVSFGHLHVQLLPGQEMISESGAMASCSSNLELRSSMKGGFFEALIMKFLGKESFFINRFFNKSSTTASLVLTQDVPGEICHARIENDFLFIQAGSFIACTPGVSFKLSWAGFQSWLGGEGFFRLRIFGSGDVWYGACGAVIEKEIDGEYIVDTGHLLSYPKDMKLKIELAGGIFSSFFGGEGLVLKLIGKGKIRLQTRSIEGMANWMNPWFWS